MRKPIVREGAPSMIYRMWTSKPAAVAALALGLATTGCGSNPKPQMAAARPAVPTPAQKQTPVPPPPPPSQPVVDPIAALISESQGAFENGERELKAGHLDRARLSFDHAVEVLLESPYGARTDVRLREHFDRLVDRINAYEVTALAQGDGFTEKRYEAAPIDELLKAATTFPAPTADAATKAAVAADLQNAQHDIPIPEQPKVLS